MALQNNAHLYTGGAERFNSQPHVALYANLMAKKQARDDAYDEYIRSLNKNINSAGLRNQDRQAFDERLADWQKYGMDNKDAIRKRTGGADMEFQRKYQDVMNLVAESKTEEEKKKPVVELLLDPTKRDRLNNDKFLQTITAHDAPLMVKDESGNWVRNPNRKTLDLSTVEFDPKPFEQDKYFKQFEDVKKQDLAPVITPDRKTMTQNVTTTSVFDREAKDLIANRAVTDYVENKSFKELVDKLDPKKFNTFYKEHYGHDIETPADLAVAYTLKGLQQKTVTQKIEPDWISRDNQNFAQQKALLALRHAYDKDEASFREELKNVGEAKGNMWIDSHVDGLVQKAKSGNVSQILEIGGKKIKEKQLPNDPVLRNSLKNGNVIPDYVTVTADGKLRPVFLSSGVKSENGGYKYDAIISQPAELESVKLSLGKTSGVKHMNEEMSGNAGGAPPSSTKTTSGKTKTSKPKKVVQNGVEYTLNEATGNYE